MNASAFYKGIQDAINSAIKGVEPFRATVVNGNVDGKVQVQRLGADEPDAEPYGKLGGFQVFAGQEVAAINLGGKPFVLGRINRSGLTSTYIEDDLYVSGRLDSFGDAYMFENFSVDGVSNFYNTVNIHGAVTGNSFNSPVVQMASQTLADTTSTTSTTTYSTAITRTYTLPAGTWTVWVHASCEFAHSVGSAVRFYTAVNGSAVPYGSFAQSFPSTYSQATQIAVLTGRTGDVTVSMHYRANTAATAYARSPTIMMIAVRTS